MAHHGTIFLGEIGEMTLRMQALLLRFLGSAEIQRVGRPCAVACRSARARGDQIAIWVDRIATKSRSSRR